MTAYAPAKAWSALLPGALTCAVLLCGQAPAASDPGPPFYYSDGERITLHRSTSHIALRTIGSQAGSTHAELQRTLGAGRPRTLPMQGLTLYSLQRGVSPRRFDEVLKGLESRPDVSLVAPVYRAPGALMIVTDQFIARCSRTVDRSDLEAMNHRYGVELVRQAPWDADTYILRVPEGDALRLANAYHTDPRIEYAHPDFVRIMDPRPRDLSPASQRVVVGPDGSRLHPTTEPPAGAPGYRIVERATYDLPAAATREASGQAHSARPAATVTRKTIKSESFEGNFPNKWKLSGTPSWRDVTFRSYSGSWSGFSGPSPPGPYPKTANTWMVYGPFSLADAADARADMQAWVRTKVGDVLFLGASKNGSNYQGIAISGDWATTVGGSGWMNISFDFKRDPGENLLGESSVWFAIALIADGDNQVAQGVYIDDFILEKITGGYVNIIEDASFDHLQWSLNNTEQSWGVESADVRAPLAWTVAPGSNKLSIAIIDDGVDNRHTEFGMAPGYDATGNGSGGWPTGNDAHGTNVAGIARALGRELAGMALWGPIVPVRVFVGGTTQDSWLADGISWAADNGADVLNNSWGGGSPSTAITSAIRAARNDAREGKGAVVVFSSGNDDGAVLYPASLPETLAVGALSQCDERKTPTSCDGEFWWGSNYGPELDLTAPGVDMYSTDRVGAAGYSPTDYFHDFGGTSAAAPLVSGVVILMMSVDPSLTADEIEDRLKMSADDIGSPGFDNETGYGRLNAHEAVLAADPVVTLTVSRMGSGSGTVTSNPGSINCGATCTQRYFRGTLVQLTATPNPPASFTGWGGAADCVDGLVTVDDDMTCTATFELPTHVLTITKAGTGTGTVNTDPTGITCGATCAAGFYEGTVVDLFGRPDPGFKLESWGGHADCTDSSATIGAAMACEATFNPCIGPPVLLLPPQTVSTPQTFEACNSVQAGGGGFIIEAGGSVTFSAGNSAVLENGFQVLEGGELSIVFGLPILE